MVVLYILGVLAAIIILLMLVPVGADIAYENEEFRFSAVVCGIKVFSLPKPPSHESEEKKPKKEKKKKEAAAEEEEKPKQKKKFKMPFNKDEILALLKVAIKSLGKFGKVRVDRFLLHFVSATGDPYDTVMKYNYVNAALSSLAPLCKKAFIVKHHDVWTDIDFLEDKMHIDFGLCISIRIGQVFRVVFALLFGALGILIKNKIRRRKEKKLEKTLNTEEEAADSSSENIEETITENTQENERTDSNG